MHYLKQEGKEDGSTFVIREGKLVEQVLYTYMVNMEAWLLY